MKKCISYLIIFALCITMFPVTTFASEAKQRYTVEQMESIVNKYENNEDVLNAIFCNDSAVGYWGMINDIKQNGALTWALDMSSKLIGEYPEKQDYAEILANLITMQSGELAEQIETQSRFDDLKDIGDYAWDVIEIAAAFVGASGDLETISTAIGTGVDGVSDVIIKNNNQAKYYEATLQDYSQSYAILSAISEYAENEELRNVALSLLNANDTLFVKRLEYLSDVGGNIAEYEAKFFVNNMSMELLKEVDLYATDENVKWFVDKGINLKNAVLSALDAAKFAFKMTILAGDIGFGTSDVYNRYQEMKTVADIADALVKANNAIVVPSGVNQSNLEIIQEKCNYYKALLVTHARGEYLLYQLLMNDAGTLSDIRWIIEYFKNPEDTTEAWYESQIEVLTEYCDILDDMFVVSETVISSEIGETLVLSQDEQYGINIFLSNFSEQWFNESYVWDEQNDDYVLVTDKFESKNADTMQLVDFACLYAKINMSETEFIQYNGYSYEGVSINTVNSLTQRFFGQTVNLEDIRVGEFNEYIGYTTVVIDDKVCRPAADGKTYNNMAVAEQVYDLHDGTLQVNFIIYSISDEEIAPIASTIQDKSVYYFTPEQANANSSFKYHLSGTAVIEPYTSSDGKESYQLISYEVVSKDTDKERTEIMEYYDLDSYEFAKMFNMQINEGVGGCNGFGQEEYLYRRGKWGNYYSISLHASTNLVDAPGGFQTSVISEQYSIYGVYVGMNYDECIDMLDKQGFILEESETWNVDESYYYYLYNATGSRIQINIYEGICDGIEFWPSVYFD